MKAGLIVKLIEAHSAGNEAQFEKALLDLASDEERKGNISTALSLRKAYSRDRKHSASMADTPLSGMTYLAQGALAVPKDRDSTLELVDVMYSTVKLEDVALTEKTHAALAQILEEQKNAECLLSRGITPTNRVLFCGPPGCGKTLAANALAGELGIPVAYVKLDGLVSSYLGQTGANIRKTFEFVRNKRIMLFLDEFDAVAKQRDDSHELGELKRVVTTLLQNLDAMPANVFLVSATNHHHLLDPAIWRRFHLSILMELPDEQQRRTMIRKGLDRHLAGYDVDVDVLAVLTDGMSGSQVCTFVESLAKHCIMKRTDPLHVPLEDIANIWLKQTTLFAGEENENYTKALLELNKNGVSIRTLERITGIPKSTLSYRFSKEAKPDGGE